MRREMAEVLVRTGPGTPLGKVMRRYWVPALLQDEIAEPDCAITNGLNLIIVFFF